MKNYIIPIFIPNYGCPHTCVFCNQHKITGIKTDMTPEKIFTILGYHLERIDRERYIEVAFYGGSFTALTLAKQTELLAPAQLLFQQGKIQAIRISTRPDCIDEQTLQHLIAHGVRTVEIGVQSFDDHILVAAQRGHTQAAVHNAVALIRQTNLQLGIQLMPGLPGDTWRSILYTLERTIQEKPDFVRIYPTIVLDNTALAMLFIEKAYKPLSLHEAVTYCMLMKAAFAEHGIVVIRTGLQATKELNDPQNVLAGPYHPSFGEMVDAYAFQFMVCRTLEQLAVKKQVITLHHHPRDTSKVRGNKNGNTRKWYSLYQPKKILFQADLTQIGQIIIECDGQRYFQSQRCMDSI